jgi:hypothetical protein
MNKKHQQITVNRQYTLSLANEVSAGLRERLDIYCSKYKRATVDQRMSMRCCREQHQMAKTNDDLMDVVVNFLEQSAATIKRLPAAQRAINKLYRRKNNEYDAFHEWFSQEDDDKNYDDLQKCKIISGYFNYLAKR